MRSNFSPRPDPQMPREWTLCFSHHKIIQELTRQLLASGTPSQNSLRAWATALMTLPSSSSHFWHQSGVYIQRLFYQKDHLDVIGLAKFQSFILTSGRKLGTYAPEDCRDYIKLIHQISSNIIVLHDWPQKLISYKPVTKPSTLMLNRDTKQCCSEFDVCWASAHSGCFLLEEFAVKYTEWIDCGRKEPSLGLEISACAHQTSELPLSWRDS